MLTPDYYVRSVQDIDLKELSDAGVDTLLIDFTDAWHSSGQ